MSNLIRSPRVANRQTEIVQSLRDRIVEGRLAPGSQLPTRLEIEQSFGASPITVQKALEDLKRDGFVEVNGRRGTYVAENPPHLTRYALVFASLPSSGVRWSRFWSTLVHEAPGVEKALERHLTLYYDINEERNSRDYHRLVQEVRAHRIAGLIFPWNPSPIGPTPLLDDPNMARVVLAPKWRKTTMPSVYYDNESFFCKALDYLRSQGRTKVAFISVSGFDHDEIRDSTFQLATQYGFETRPYWWQVADAGSPHSACNIAHLMFQERASERPDAFIITDDNLTEGATAGLLTALSNRVEDVSVVTHANFPLPPSSAVPVKRLGFDTRLLLKACIESIDRQRRGVSMETPTVIPAMFEDEI